MKRYVSDNEIFITYDSRSASKYQTLLTENIIKKFGRVAITDPVMLRTILEECYDWSSQEFTNTITGINDKLFVGYLFAYHEASVNLWLRVLREEDIETTINVNEDDLSMNRRVFRLALEQTCDVNYTHLSKASYALIKRYDDVIEDLLFLGSELIGFAQYLAEMRMVPNTLFLDIDPDGKLRLVRPPHLEAIFSALTKVLKEDFKRGIIDENGVQDMKIALQSCMNINYDFAGHQIFKIKQTLNPENWEFQTIEPGILIQNLIANGANQKNATDFHNGLILSRHNKLSIKESVYKVNAMERHFFRPILVIQENGTDRELIGKNKWTESITVLATNGFQWNKASNEWKNNSCFSKFLDHKSNVHDKLLEDEVVKVLTKMRLPYDRNVLTISDGFQTPVKIDVQGIGEMDFIWMDVQRNIITVADCKYNRARYDMLSFSADYSNFKQQYETKLANKVHWVKANKILVYKHLLKRYPGLTVDALGMNVEGIFIINTPTFYMFHGKVKTVSFFRLEEFIKNTYNPPDLTIWERSGVNQRLKIIRYPYFGSNQD